MPSWPEATNWPTGVNWPTGTNWPTGESWPGGGGPPPPTSYQWKDFFPGAFQVGQTDFGLTYSPTLRRTFGTATAAISRTGTPMPIMVQAVNGSDVGAGGDFAISFDSGGSFPITGLVPTPGVPVALTGAGAGASITFTAGTAPVGNIWKVTASGLADQSGNARHYTQADPLKQPAVEIGLNGKPSLYFDGYMPSFVSGPFSMPYPAQVIVIGTLRTPLNFTSLVSAQPGYQASLITQSAAIISAHSGAGVLSAPTGFPLFTPFRISALYTASIADALKVGNLAQVTGTNCGAVVGSTHIIGPGDASRTGDFELYAVIKTPPVADLSAFEAALNTPLGYGPGSIVV